MKRNYAKRAFHKTITSKATYIGISCMLNTNKS